MQGESSHNSPVIGVLVRKSAVFLGDVELLVGGLSLCHDLGAVRDSEIAQQSAAFRTLDTCDLPTPRGIY